LNAGDARRKWSKEWESSMNGISWRMGFFMMLIGGKIKIMNEDEFNKMREK